MRIEDDLSLTGSHVVSVKLQKDKFIEGFVHVL